jgi:hypothetical protein
MKTTIQHPIYGRIEYDDETDQVNVLRRDLAERITWMLKPKNSHLLGHGYYPDTFLRACEVLGITQAPRRSRPPAKNRYQTVLWNERLVTDRKGY